MGKRLQNIRERFGIPSGRAIIHIVIVQLAIQGIWSWVSRMFIITLVREIGFLVLFVAGLVIVAWYLPKLAPVFSGAITRRTAATQGTVDIQYPTQVRDTLNALIQRGEDLCDKMKEKDFSKWHLEPVVREWLNNIDHDVWEVIPEHAGYIVGEQGDLTEDEKLRYQGWKWDAASLRISVDRRLNRLREIRSQIRVADKEYSESQEELSIDVRKCLVREVTEKRGHFTIDVEITLKVPSLLMQLAKLHLCIADEMIDPITVSPPIPKMLEAKVEAYTAKYEPSYKQVLKGRAIAPTREEELKFLVGQEKWKSNEYKAHLLLLVGGEEVESQEFMIDFSSFSISS